MINPISAKNDTSINFPAAVTRKIRAERTVTIIALFWFKPAMTSFFCNSDGIIE